MRASDYDKQIHAHLLHLRQLENGKKEETGFFKIRFVKPNGVNLFVINRQSILIAGNLKLTTDSRKATVFHPKMWEYGYGDFLCNLLRPIAQKGKFLKHFTGDYL